jgi:hypothetical protein
MPDLTNIDPATLQSGHETDRLICELLGWEFCDEMQLWKIPKPEEGYQATALWSFDGKWSARLRGIFGTWKPHSFGIPTSSHMVSHVANCVMVTICLCGNTRYAGVGFVSYSETDGDVVVAEALAVCRAFVAAMKAKANAQGNP